jgi:hypothetical protein
MDMSRVVPTAALLLVCSLVLAGTSSARGKPGGGGGGGGATGYDVSYPQCGGALPTKVLFGIVGVNDGIVYSANPCLSTEIAWAETYETTAILYANTADPGPVLSKYWPSGQSDPKYCDPATPDSLACSYDYGWNAAADSYRDAVSAYVALGQLSMGATRTPTPNEWWLDVESANSWEENTDNNVAALQGEVAYLESQGVTTIGFYANANDWQAITGNTGVFVANPSWRAGSGSQHIAQSHCNEIGITGALIKYSQYSSGGFDADVRCYG